MKENIDIISYVLCHNFSNFLFDSLFPNKLTETNITPAYKKEEKCLKENSQPVSILPNVSKIYERLFFDQINAYFETILSKAPSGFWKGYSAKHCLIVLIEECPKFLDEGEFSGNNRPFKSFWLYWLRVTNC